LSYASKTSTTGVPRIELGREGFGDPSATLAVTPKSIGVTGLEPVASASQTQRSTIELYPVLRYFTNLLRAATIPLNK
jgi:hypothetical protein